MKPRPFRPGAMYKVTRRCTQRQFLLKPETLTHQVFGYCLGVALQRFGIKLHAAVALSNHYHLDVTDLAGNLPEFKHLLNMLVARAMNAHWGRFENFFANDAPSDVELVTPQDVIDRLVYTLTNPVKDGLVRCGAAWHGLTTYGMRFGSQRVFARPEHFFDVDGSLPPQVVIELSRPDILPELSDDELFVVLMRQVKAKERTLTAEVRRAGRRFLGMSRVLRQRPTESPCSREPRFNLNPRLASKSKWQRIAALQRDKQWLAAYRDAYERFCQGLPHALFPFGTYLMRVRFGVACQSP